MKPNNRLGTVSVGTLQLLLTPRDIAIIHSVREHRFLATRHIHALHFAGHASYTSGIRACTRVLTRLLEHRLLVRLSRPIGGGGGGSASFVWGVGAAGDRLLRADPENGFTKRLRPYEPTALFLAHTLAIADTRIRVEALAREGVLELLEVTTEPGNWRPFNSGGRSQVLKPDLYVVTVAGEDEWHRYIEVDRGTESIQALLKKCRIYQDYAGTGTDEAELGVIPQVLWLMPALARANAFAAALEQDRRLDGRLHRIITFDQLESELTRTSSNGPQPEKGGQ